MFNQEQEEYFKFFWKRRKLLLTFLTICSVIGGGITSLTFWLVATGFSIGTLGTTIEPVKPFDFSLQKNCPTNVKVEKSCINQDIKLKKIYLVKSPIQHNENEVVTWVVRRHIGLFGSEPIGTVTAPKVDREFSVPKLIKYIKSQYFYDVFNSSSGLIGSAYAQSAQTRKRFDWEGEEYNYDFYEKYIDENTIRRLYSNGRILEYKVDSNGRLVSSSLRWIK